MTYNAKDKLWRVRWEDSLLIALFVERDMIWKLLSYYMKM